MSFKAHVDVLICGAGAAGLTLALDLARSGVSYRIIEKLATPFQGSRGKGIQPRTQEIFEDFNVLNRIVAAGGEYPLLRNYSADGAYSDKLMKESNSSRPGEPHTMHLMIPQFLTEAVLRNALTELGGNVEFDSELIDFTQNKNQVVSRIKTANGEETISSNYLVGTDGGKSFVRHNLNIDFPGKTLGVRAVVADILIDGISPDYWHRWGDQDMTTQISLCPLRGTDMFQLQGPIPLEGDIDLTAKGLTDILQNRSGRKDLIVKEVRWASAYNMNARLADKYQIDRVFLCGDAAHIHPPTGGQGLNTSVQDAYNLGWKLRAVLSGAPDALLNTYEEERKPIAAEMLGLATKLLDTAKKGELGPRDRNVQQLDLNYRESSLSVDERMQDSSYLIHAGDRAPDAEMLGSAGQNIRLFDLTKGPHWTLIGYGDQKIPNLQARKNLHIHHIGEKSEIIDNQKQFAKNFGVQNGDYVLIRPDGYIGFITSSTEFHKLENYLESVGLKMAL